MKISKAYLLCLLFAFLGGLNASVQGAKHPDKFIQVTLPHELIFQQAPVGSNALSYNYDGKEQNEKEKEKEFEDDNDKEEDDKEQVVALIHLHTLLAGNIFKSSSPDTGSLPFFFLKKSVPLFVLFHSWKSHLS